MPSSYVKNIIDGVVPKIGVNFEEEKELYQIKVVLFLNLSSSFTVLNLLNNLLLTSQICFLALYSCLTSPDQIPRFHANAL